MLTLSVSLLVAVRKRYISGETLKKWAGVAAIVSAIVATITLLINLPHPDRKNPIPKDIQSFVEPQMIAIPAGDFLVGSSEIENALPAGKQYLDKCFVAKFEVTNEEYKYFLLASPQRPVPAYWDEKKFNVANQPVVGVSWFDAIDYCNWLSQKTGKTYRLPTELQWEKAARGTHGKIYPWGDSEPNLKRANFSQPYGKPMRVDSYPAGMNTDYGTMNMAGNVAEWCYDSNGQPVVRGGSWRDNAELLRCASRVIFDPSVKRENIGFRVVLIP